MGVFYRINCRDVFVGSLGIPMIEGKNWGVGVLAHIGRVFLIVYPIEQVIGDIGADAFPIGLVTDDVFVVIPLPQFTRKGMPTKLFDAANVFMRGDGFECADNFAKRRGDPCGRP
jgi:hypothetical protein